MANDSDFATLPIVDVNLFLSGSLESEEVVQECKKVGNMPQKILRATARLQTRRL